MPWSVLLLVGGLACSADGAVAEGKAALEAHELQRAEEAWRTALRREPDRPDALAGLGWTYHLAGERDAAREAFARCVDVHPEAADCLRGLGSIALAENQVAIARDLLGRALVADPEDPRVRASMALLQLSTGDLQAATATYEELAARFPEKPEYQLGLAECKLRSGAPVEAAAATEAALALPAVSPRTQAMLWQLRARALVAASAGKEDPNRCEATAPPVRAWLEAADASVTQAETLGLALPELASVKRLIARRRQILERACPAGSPSASALFDGTTPAAAPDAGASP